MSVTRETRFHAHFPHCGRMATLAGHRAAIVQELQVEVDDPTPLAWTKPENAIIKRDRRMLGRISTAVHQPAATSGASLVLAVRGFCSLRFGPLAVSFSHFMVAGTLHLEEGLEHEHVRARSSCDHLVGEFDRGCRR